MRLIFLTYMACIGFSSFGQSDTAYVFEFDLKFIGSSLNYQQNDYYKLEYLIDLMQEDSTMSIEVRGHVCCGPSKRISTNRAKRIYDELIKAGISPNRLKYKGYDNKYPVAFPEDSPEDEANNRRVDFIIRRNK